MEVALDMVLTAPVAADVSILERPNETGEKEREKRAWPRPICSYFMNLARL